MDNRDSIVRKLNALKATANHATTGEAEATAAMLMYHKLMQKYALTETDLDIRESGIHFWAKNTGSKQNGNMGYFPPLIVKLTNTRASLKKDDEGFLVVAFFGTMADVQYADFIYTTIETAMKTSWKAFRYSFDYTKLHRAGHHGRVIRSNFEAMFVNRMCEMLQTMIEEDRAQGTGKSLVVLKNQLIIQAMQEAGLQGNRTKGYAITVHEDKAQEALRAGYQAADKVRLRKEADHVETLLLEGK